MPVADGLAADFFRVDEGDGEGGQSLGQPHGVGALPQHPLRRGPRLHVVPGLEGHANVDRPRVSPRELGLPRALCQKAGQRVDPFVAETGEAALQTELRAPSGLDSKSDRLVIADAEAVSWHGHSAVKKGGQTTADGIFRGVNYLATGLSTQRVPEDDIIVPTVHFTKDSGELSSITLDENTRIEVLPQQE